MEIVNKSQEILICCDSKNVIVIYNCIGKSLVDICKWCDRKEYRIQIEIQKPTAIQICNKFTGDVDKSDTSL